MNLTYHMQPFTLIIRFVRGLCMNSFQISKGKGKGELVLVIFVLLSCIRIPWQAQGQHTSEFFEGSSEAVLHFNSSEAVFKLKQGKFFQVSFIGIS